MSSPSNPLLPRLALVIALGIISTAFFRCNACSSSSCFGRSLRVGTFNIRQFGSEPTDKKRLQAIIEDARPDVFAVQEVKVDGAIRDLANALSKDGRRRYSYVLAKCPGTSKMWVGFVYDQNVVRLRSTRDYPGLDPDQGGGSCGAERSGLVAKFERVEKKIGSPTGESFQLLAIHMIAGGEKEKQDKRREQWKRVHRIAEDLKKEGPIAILGDTNSTGFLDDKYGERSFIMDEAKRAGLDVLTSDLKCTEYFQPKNQPLTPSTLDHFVATPGFGRRGSVKAHAFCEELACKPTTTVPPDYTSVSDHCPVTIDLD